MDTAIFQEWYSYIVSKLIPAIKQNTEILEGNILNFGTDGRDETNMFYIAGYFAAKRNNIHVISSQNYVTDVFEIGFNSGFSALLMLISNPNIKITCVDIGWHKYVIPCYEVLKRDFGDRINLIIGDSTVVVPTITEKFDLIHIDGGHEEHIARADIDNCMKLCKNGTMVIMDDTNNAHLYNLWHSKVKEYNLKNVNFRVEQTNTHDVKVFTYRLYPLVSVVIPTYNRFSYLLNAINSVKTQTYNNIEIIVVNDCSTQSEYYAYNFEGCKIIHLQQNSRKTLGYPCGGYVRNEGIKVAQGKYVAFLDDDDVFLPNKIELQVQALENDSMCLLSATEGLIGNGVFNSSIKYPLYNREKHWNYISNRLGIYQDYPDIIDKNLLLKHNIIICSSVMVNKDFLNSINGFKNLKNGEEDYDLWLRCLEKTYCLYIKIPCVYYDEGHGDGQNY